MLSETDGFFVVSFVICLLLLVGLLYVTPSKTS